MESVEDICQLYSFDKLISKTTYGKVYLGQDMDDMSSVIIKQSQK